MSIDITALPEYGEKMRNYNIAKGAAEAAGDPTKLAEANAQWANDRSELQSRAYAARDAQRELETSRTAAAAKFPKVDPALYAHITDPAQIETAAAAIQANIDRAIAPPDPAPQSWGGAAPTSGAAVPPPPAEKSPEARLKEIMPEVIAKGKTNLELNKEARKIASAPILDKVIANMSASVGFPLE